jgi:hypothetical protein
MKKKEKKFRFDPDKAKLIQKSVEDLKNQAIKTASAEHVTGGEWRLSAFVESAP